MKCRYCLAIIAVLLISVTVADEVAKPYLTLNALRKMYGDRHGHLTNIGGVEVYYKDEGHGPAILMVHGSESSLKTWDKVAPVLTRHYRVIRYDIPPQGLSGPVSDEAAARMLPTDIAEGLLAQLGVTRITFVGVSSGGTLGVFLAAKRPELVQRLILSNTPADPVTTSHLKNTAEFEAVQQEAKQTGFKSQRFWNAFLDFFSGDAQRLDVNIRTQYYDMSRRMPEKNLVSLVAKVGDHAKAVDAMSRVTAPTLLIWGGSDPLLVPATADNLASYLTHTQVSKVMLPDVGHYPPLEVPQRFAQLVAAYIEAVTPRAGQ